MEPVSHAFVARVTIQPRQDCRQIHLTYFNAIYLINFSVVCRLKNNLTYDLDIYVVYRTQKYILTLEQHKRILPKRHHINDVVSNCLSDYNLSPEPRAVQWK
jgi:hypothetical protein